MSCKDTNKEKGDEIAIKQDPRTDFSMQRTSTDTTMVMDMANKFLQALKDKNVDAALDQLCDVKNNEVVELTQDRRNQLKNMLGTIPVEDYVIDELILYSDSDTEVRYTIEMYKNQTGNSMPNTMKGSLHPYRVNGQWYLTIQHDKNEPKYEND